MVHGRPFGLVILYVAAAFSGCAGPPPALCTPQTGPVVWVIDRGWHTEIALPAEEIAGPLATFRDVFPGARVVVFGFGKRTWITARVESPSELLMGPFPGPGAIQAVGLRVAPDAAWRTGSVTRLTLRPGRAADLSAFIWNAIGKTPSGGPRLIAPGLSPGSLFYAASHAYGPDYTCNNWTAEALRDAGLAVVSQGVVFANGVSRQIARLPQACRGG